MLLQLEWHEKNKRGRLEMNFFKRALVNVKRKWFRSAILLSLVFLLSFLAVSAILAHQSMTNTEQNLRNQMPPIVSIQPDWRILDDNPYEAMSPEVIRRLSSLPQVRYHEYTVDVNWGVWAGNMNLWTNPNYISPTFDYDEDLGVRMIIRGISSPDFLENREQFVELMEGRNFLDSEMYRLADYHPTLISTGFAYTNNLNVGSIFEIQVPIVEEDELTSEEIYVRTESFSLEVIGILNPDLPVVTRGDEFDDILHADRLRQQMEMQHRIYVPSIVAEEVFRVRGENFRETSTVWFNNMFILYDVSDLNDFTAAVDDLVGMWQVTDFSVGFYRIASAMDTVSAMADFVLVGSITAIMFIVGLVFILFIKDRKTEIGIYLALGEKKVLIFCQLVIEILIIAAFSVSLAMISGNQFASRITYGMIRREIEQINIGGVGADGSIRLLPSNFLENQGYQFEFRIDELPEMHGVGLRSQEIFIFCIITTSAIVVATAIPTLMILRLNPKKVLL